MKKTMFFIAMLFILGCSNSYAGNDRGKNNSREIVVMPFDKLSISANITVILYESSDISTVVVKGKEGYTRRIAVIQKDSRLLITTHSGANMQEHVTVFVPVNKLRSLEVSEGAVVKSQTILQSPSLQVEADEFCEITIIVNGAVQIKEGEHYALVRRIRPEHAMMRLAIPVF